MPFDFLKKKKPDDKAKDSNITTETTSMSGALRGASFDEGSKALEPKKDDAKKKSSGGGGLATIKAALGLGPKADDSQKRLVTNACDHIGLMMASATDIAGRCETLRSAPDVDLNKDVAAGVGKLISACAKLDSAGDKLATAHAQFMRDGKVAPMKSAINDAMSAAKAMKQIMYGHTGLGDSCGASALLYNFFGGDLVGGMQLGDRDKKAGKQLTGEKTSNDNPVAIPLGGAGGSIYARAIRNYADNFVVHCDAFMAGVARLDF